MPAATRLNDRCTGHGCFPPRLNTQGSPNVFINSRPAHRQGDSWASHTCGDNTHSGVTTGGSSKVYVNSRPLARIGDSISCGSVCAEGSTNVIAGG